METLNKNKQEFLLTIVPEWQKQAKQREDAWGKERRTTTN